MTQIIYFFERATGGRKRKLIGGDASAAASRALDAPSAGAHEAARGEERGGQGGGQGARADEEEAQVQEDAPRGRI